MKRIKIETADKTYLASPLTLVQLEECEGLLAEIGAEEKRIREAGSSGKMPVALLRKQTQIILMALKNHDADISDKAVDKFSVRDIGDALNKVLNGSGLEDIKEGNAGPVA